MCKLFLIPVHVVSKGNHRAVRVERFFRYMNKTERITCANVQSYAAWLAAFFFAIYGWNASPIDRTDIFRCFVAKGRMFPFPIDVALDTVPRTPGTEGTPALEHIEAMEPVLKRQRCILDLLNKERRARHRELKNKGRTQRTFEPGNIVLVRRQIQTSLKADIIAKQQFKATGPYIVLKPLPPASYLVRRIPFVEGAGAPGRPKKANASDMELLPSTLCVHKQVDGADVRFGALDASNVHNPLENSLGVTRFGQYTKANPAPQIGETPFAFTRLHEMFAEEVESSDSELSDAEETTQEADATNQETTSAAVTPTTDNAAVADKIPPRPSRWGKRKSHQPATSKAKTATDQIASWTRDWQKEQDNTQRSIESTFEGVAGVRETFGDTGEDTMTRETEKEGRPPSPMATDGDARSEEGHTPSRLELYQSFEESRDKMCIVRHKPHRSTCDQWYVIQIDLQETVKRRALQHGRYHANW